MEKETILLSGFDPERDENDIARAGEILRAGGIVAIPTETVYGLAGNALDPAATAKIYAAKGRPSDNPLIVHIQDISEWPPLVRELPEQAGQLAKAYWPGPLTIILPKSDAVPDATSGGLDTVAVRMPENAVAREVIRAAGVPLAAPSANRSGSPSPTTWRHCVDDLMGRVDAILCSGDCRVGVESTVLSLCQRDENGRLLPRLLRPGAVTLGQLREVLGEVIVDRGVLEHLEEGEKALSPGMKYKHYAPAAEVTLVGGTPAQYRDYLRRIAQPGDFAMCFTEDLPVDGMPACPYGGMADHREQARQVFRLLRELDGKGAKRVFVHTPEKDGVGLAVYNRLVRAAAFRVIEPQRAGRNCQEGNRKGREQQE